jgi:hypothetical protein
VNDAKDFFAASVGSAAALIGLLFVAITLAPDTVFGASADPRKRAQAASAFVALANVFFVSLAALAGPAAPRIVVVLALLSAYQIVREGMLVGRLFPGALGLRRFAPLSLCIYACELVLAARLSLGVGDGHGLLYIALGLYGYALGAAWMLVGSREGVV